MMKIARSRIVSAAFSHETNGVSRMSTGLAEFEAGLLAIGEEIRNELQDTGHEMAGVLQAARDHDWQLVLTIAGSASPSGAVTMQAWDLFIGKILSGCEASGDESVEGVLLCLHGAMATSEFLDAEGELLRRVRDKVGKKVPIAITLDLHANVTADMTRYADIICAYRTYPHIDQKQTVARAAALLQQAILTKNRPHTLIARRDISTGLDDGRTTIENPMTKLLRRVAAIESTHGDIATISLHAGFNLAALPGAGPSVTVSYWQDADGAREIAEELMDYVFETRDFDSNTYLSVEEALQQAKRVLAAVGKGPVVLADYADNPGAGAYGDSTEILRGMIETDVRKAAIGAMCDPQVAEQLSLAGLGADATITLGGKIDPLLSSPLTLTGTVVGLSDGRYVARGPYNLGETHHLGLTAVLRVGGVDVVIASNLLQCTELELFSHIGINPHDKELLVVKSMHHFRAAFAPIARDVFVVDAGGMVGLLVAPIYARMRTSRGN
jgi:microcystin degradation protein MlrC